MTGRFAGSGFKNRTGQTKKGDNHGIREQGNTTETEGHAGGEASEALDPSCRKGDRRKEDRAGRARQRTEGETQRDGNPSEGDRSQCAADGGTCRGEGRTPGEAEGRALQGEKSRAGTAPGGEGQEEKKEGRRGQAPAGLGSLWKFPGGILNPEEPPEEGLVRIAREELGIEIGVGVPLAAVKHAYAHFRITLTAFVCTLREGIPAGSPWRWSGTGDLEELPFSKADRLIARSIAP
ncbi:MAG: NUDIX domain-containing protein, partial [Proteobacteria bacterium]|nr:NUDIX domain-containing protein [Pseudomonadota bacterium]